MKSKGNKKQSKQIIINIYLLLIGRPPSHSKHWVTTTHDVKGSVFEFRSN